MAYLDGLNAVWEDVKSSFLSSMASSAVELWFGNMKLISFGADTLTFSIDAAFKYDLVKEKFLSKIEDEFEARLGFRVKVEITCAEITPKEEKKIDYSAGGTGFHYEGEDDPEEIVMPDPILPSGDGFEAELFRTKSEEYANETPEEREARINKLHQDMIKRFRKELENINLDIYNTDMIRLYFLSF